MHIKSIASVLGHQDWISMGESYLLTGSLSSPKMHRILFFFFKFYMESDIGKHPEEQIMSIE